MTLVARGKARRKVATSWSNYPTSLRDELLAHAKLLQSYGPDLKGSKHANMKELRFAWERQVWRMAFAFDPKRSAVLLAGNKGGVDQKRFYKRLIASADRRFDEHIASLKPPAKKR